MKVETKISFKEYAKLLYSLTYQKPMMKILLCIAALIVLWIACYYMGDFNLPKPVIYQYVTLLLITVVQPVVIL